MSLARGTRLGPYEVTAQIGAGGMGEVYRATDTTLGRQAAIKVLPEAFAQDADRLARFEHEAKTLASLSHPNVATIHGVERSQGSYALVMDPEPEVHILMLDVGGGSARPQGFLERAFADADAVFSPDGRFVAYRSTETGQEEVYIRPYPGPGGQETVSVGGGQQPVWTANGELFYRDLTGERMMAVAVTTTPTLKLGTPRQVFRGTFYNVVPGGSTRPQYDVTADGKRFVMLETDAAVRPKFVIVEHWVEDLKRLLPVD